MLVLAIVVVYALTSSILVIAKKNFGTDSTNPLEFLTIAYI
jgi:hypothetical protein